MLIEDPKTGHVATVTDEGFLRILGVAIPWETHHSLDHEAAYASGNLEFTMDGSDNYVLWLRNDSQTDKLLVTGFTASTNDDAGAKFTMFAGSEEPTAGHTLGGAANLNFISRNVAEITSYYGDAMTSANGHPVFSGFVGIGQTSLGFAGALVLGYKDTIAIKAIGTNLKKGTVGLRFFYHGGRF